MEDTMNDLLTKFCFKTLLLCALHFKIIQSEILSNANQFPTLQDPP